MAITIEQREHRDAVVLASVNHRVRAALDAARLTPILQLTGFPDTQHATSR